MEDVGWVPWALGEEADRQVVVAMTAALAPEGQQLEQERGAATAVTTAGTEAAVVPGMAQVEVEVKRVRKITELEMVVAGIRAMGAAPAQVLRESIVGASNESKLVCQSGHFGRHACQLAHLQLRPTQIRLTYKTSAAQPKGYICLCCTDELA